MKDEERKPYAEDRRGTEGAEKIETMLGGQQL
jgi:hypothetical protein